VLRSARTVASLAVAGSMCKSSIVDGRRRAGVTREPRRGARGDAGASAEHVGSEVGVALVGDVPAESTGFWESLGWAQGIGTGGVPHPACVQGCCRDRGKKSGCWGGVWP